MPSTLHGRPAGSRVTRRLGRQQQAVPLRLRHQLHLDRRRHDRRSVHREPALRAPASSTSTANTQPTERQTPHMKNKRRIIGILAAVILAIIGTVALVGYVQSAKDKAVAEEALVDVYVVDKLVPKGATAETIKSSVSVEQVPARLEQPGAITDLEDVGANVAATDLQPGDQLLAARLVPKDAGGRGGQGQGADLGACSRPSGPSAGRCRRVTSSASTSRSIPSTSTRPAQDARGRPATDRRPTRRADEPPIDHGRGVDCDRTQKKTPNMTRLEFQHVLVTNVQTTNEPVMPDDERPDRTRRAGHRVAVHRHAGPLARAVGALRVRHRVRPRVAVERAGHRLRRRHTARHPRQRLHGGEVMGTTRCRPSSSGTTCPPSWPPTCRPPSQGMGVVVKANGFAPPAAPDARSSSWSRPRAAPARPPSPPTSPSRSPSASPAGWSPSTSTCSSATWAPALALHPEHTLAQLARTSQIDATTIKLFLTPYEPGLYVLCRRPRPRSRPTRSATRTSRRCSRCWRRTSTTWSWTRRPVSTSARWRPSSAPPICCWCRAST